MQLQCNSICTNVTIVVYIVNSTDGIRPTVFTAPKPAQVITGKFYFINGANSANQFKLDDPSAQNVAIVTVVFQSALVCRIFRLEE